MTPPAAGRRVLLILPLALLTATPGWSQAAPGGGGHDRLWLTLGAGLGRTGARPARLIGGLAGGAGFTYQPSLLLFSLQAEGVWNPFHADALGHAALLLGVGTRSEHSHVSLALGPALTGGDLRSFHSTREQFESELGLAVQAQLLALPLPSLGAGLTGFVNLNHRQSFGGLLFTLAFGQLR